ncbi:hypothetical protein HDU76_000975 [Blyttiomyces sp. JEL0837]|nr:hypothetical protein HDU76_000975 [Blyttiomyces sp. JEL0837]
MKPALGDSLGKRNFELTLIASMGISVSILGKGSDLVDDGDSNLDQHKYGHGYSECQSLNIGFDGTNGANSIPHTDADPSSQEQIRQYFPTTYKPVSCNIGDTFETATTAEPDIDSEPGIPTKFMLIIHTRSYYYTRSVPAWEQIQREKRKLFASNRGKENLPGAGDDCCGCTLVYWDGSKILSYSYWCPYGNKLGVNTARVVAVDAREPESHEAQDENEGEGDHMGDGDVGVNEIPRRRMAGRSNGFAFSNVCVGCERLDENRAGSGFTFEDSYFETVRATENGLKRKLAGRPPRSV